MGLLFKNDEEENGTRTSRMVTVFDIVEFREELKQEIDDYKYTHHDASKTKYLGYKFLHIKFKGIYKKEIFQSELEQILYGFSYGAKKSRGSEPDSIRYGLDFSEATIEEYKWSSTYDIHMPEYLILPIGDKDRFLQAAGSMKKHASWCEVWYSDFAECDGEWVYSTQQDGIAIRYIGSGTTLLVPRRFKHRMDGVFDICSWVEKLIFPSHLASTSVPNNCFAKIENLRKLSFEKGITGIGSRAAYGLLWLEEVEFPDTITSLGDESFCGCVNLREARLPKKLECIGAKAFANCCQLEKVEVPQTAQLTSIGAETFFNCTSLKEIVLPDTVTVIGDYAFENCLGLERFIAPNANFSRSISALTNCRNLKEIACAQNTYPHLYPLNYFHMPVSDLNNLLSVEENGKKMIEGYTLTCSIEELENFGIKKIPIFNLKVTGTLDKPAFEKILDWTTRQPITVWGFDFSDGEFAALVPENYISLEKNAMQVSYVLFPPSGKTYCAENSFDTETTQIYYSDEVHRKGLWLTDKTETKGIKWLGTTVIYSGPSKFITSFANDAFIVRNMVIEGEKWDGSVVQTVYIPQNVETIQEECFCHSRNMKKIVVNNGAKEIQNRAFAECPKLEEITIPHTVQKIGVDILKDCPALKKVCTTKALWETVKRTGGIAGDVLCNIEFVEYDVPEKNTEIDYRFHFELEDYHYRFDAAAFDPQKIKKFDHMDTLILSFTGKFTSATLKKLMDWTIEQKNIKLLILDMAQVSYGASLNIWRVSDAVRNCLDRGQELSVRGTMVPSSEPTDFSEDTWRYNTSILFVPEGDVKFPRDVAGYFCPTAIHEVVLPDSVETIDLDKCWDAHFVKINTPKNLKKISERMELPYLGEKYRQSLLQATNRPSEPDIVET